MYAGPGIHRVLYRRWFCGYTTKNITSARMYEYCCVCVHCAGPGIHRVLYCRWFCGYATKNITSARMYEYCCVRMQGPVFTEFYRRWFCGYTTIIPTINNWFLQYTFRAAKLPRKKIEFTQHKKYTAVLFQTVQFEMITNSLRDFV